MDSAKNQLAEKLKAANNVLVTVSRDPSVDQLAALLGLTLALNKTGKHAAAVFSGQVPSTLEFLQPEETIEKNTDSLRDFIIALDKAKADKLRYKVEDEVVRIFITPYKTSISEEDLAFSQGDFNVDLVIAIGVRQQEDLDEAITAHGRILHDATVASINTLSTQEEGLGSINWHDDQASSLSELATELVQVLDNDLLDAQIATAFLTGIVAETERFSNEKTSSQTMSISAALMAVGANQQLVASKLEEPVAPIEIATDVVSDDSSDSHDGMIEITHDATPAPDTAEPEVPEPVFELPAPEEETEVPETPPQDNLSPGARLITEPPTLGGQLTANSQPEALDPSTDPMSAPADDHPGMLTHDDAPATPSASVPEPADLPTLTPPPTDWNGAAPANDTTAVDSPTLADLEASVTGEAPKEAAEIPAPDLNEVRDEVSKALNSDPAAQPVGPIAALNAQPLGDNLHPLEIPVPPEIEAPATQGSGYTSVEDLIAQSSSAPVASPDEVIISPTVPLPDDVLVQQTPAEPVAPADPNAPPPVPPPLPFQFGQPAANSQTSQNQQ